MKLEIENDFTPVEPDPQYILQVNALKKYFPKSYTAKQMEKVIIKLLDNWLKKRQQTQEL